MKKHSESSTEAAENKFSHNNSFQMGTNSESEAFKESACCDGCINMEFIVYILIFVNHITVAPSAFLAFYLLCTLFQMQLFLV